MANENAPNDAARKSKAEGERWESDSDTMKRADRQAGESAGDQAGGITNRPLEEEEENQAMVPDRGESREGAHAGHGDGGSSRSNQKTDAGGSER